VTEWLKQVFAEKYLNALRILNEKFADEVSRDPLEQEGRRKVEL